MASFQYFIAILLIALSEFAQQSMQLTVRGDRVHKDTKLSDQDHYEGGSHNAEYDHEAFLGTEEAKKFDHLTPEESKKRLGQLVERIDKDKDGFVSEAELRDFIDHQQRRSMYEFASHTWGLQNKDGDSELSWDEYNKTTYSGLSVEQLVHLYPNLGFPKRVSRDRKKWEAADQNGDQVLSIEEFTTYLQPEEFPHMRHIVVDNAMEDIDKDGNGYVSLEEYLADISRSYGDDEGSEAEWKHVEEEQFKLYRDKNGDGRMDKEEVGEWILPTTYDHLLAEAKHLLHEADTNKDNKLTKQEIVSKYDVFVGSQATSYGEALKKHDEF